jgi:hypothetical protein
MVATMTEMTLLLNATYEPITVVPWQRAMTLWASGKAEVVDEYETELRSVSFSFRVPSIVRLLRFVRARTSTRGTTIVARIAAPTTSN